MAANAAQRRYNTGVLLCSLGYMAALFGGEAYFAHHPGAHGPAAYLAAIVPAVLVIEIFVLIGRYLIDERDEYLRLLMVRQVLVASGIALSLATLWGFLESFALAPHIDAYWIAVVWFGGLGVGAVANRLVWGRPA